MLTYAVSAKTSEGVNLCFQKIAAELLGIRLLKSFKALWSVLIILLHLIFTESRIDWIVLKKTII